MKKILIVLLCLFILIIASLVGCKLVSANVEVQEIKDIITTQSNREVYLTPYGYTLDNPNVILNPYGISPLTAIILFETKENLPVTITIKGKDANSTYKNTFESEKKHYIPVYGLYPNTTNYITLECGNKTKTITIETSPLPMELSSLPSVTNDTNKLTFITSNDYPYALDNNNEVRWYLTKKYSDKINYLENGHLLLGSDTLNSSENPNGLLEIDLLGKIHKQYTLNTGYLGSYAETTTSLFVLSNNLLEIDKQTGTILESITLKEQYNKVFYEETNNTINLSNQQNTLTINLDTKKQIKHTNSDLISESSVLLPLYNTNKNYKLTEAVKSNLTKATKQSDKNIFLIGYINPDSTYNSYNIKMTKTIDNFQITGNFKKNDEVYLILDKFLDKKVYDIDYKNTIINKQGLSGKYSIYISINDTIYKTNKYIKF